MHHVSAAGLPGRRAPLPQVPKRRWDGYLRRSAGGDPTRRDPTCAVQCAELAQGGVFALLTFNLLEKQGDAARDSGKAPPSPVVAPVFTQKKP